MTMTFITYLFLGLCLPMAAFCAGQECACQGQTKQLITFQLSDGKTYYMVYIDIDENWAFRSTGMTDQVIAYDMNTMTRYVKDGATQAGQCEESSIAENDEVFKYLCIDKDPVIEHYYRGPQIKMTVNNDEEKTTRTYHLILQDDGQCSISFFDFELSPSNSGRATLRGEVHRSRQKMFYDETIDFCKKH